MSPILRLTLLLGTAALLAGCVATPAPQYQPAIANTETLLQQRPHVAVGDFSAAPNVENRSLTIRAARLEGAGRDGTFATYLREALITELKTAGCYDEASVTSVKGVLVRNELKAAIGEGHATVGAEFTVSRGGETVYRKTLVAEHQWESSFMGAIAIPTAMDNYAATVQKLLGKLFADPEFIASVHGPQPVSKPAGG